MPNKLLPCPFCGSDAVVETSIETMYMPVCQNMNCFCVSGTEFNTEKEAIEAWNKRAYPEKTHVNICERDDYYSVFLRESIEKSIKENHFREVTKKE